MNNRNGTTNHVLEGMTSPLKFSLAKMATSSASVEPKKEVINKSATLPLPKPLPSDKIDALTKINTQPTQNDKAKIEKLEKQVATLITIHQLVDKINAYPTNIKHAILEHYPQKELKKTDCEKYLLAIQAAIKFVKDKYLNDINFTRRNIIEGLTALPKEEQQPFLNKLSAYAGVSNDIVDLYERLIQMGDLERNLDEQLVKHENKKRREEAAPRCTTAKKLYDYDSDFYPDNTTKPANSFSIFKQTNNDIFGLSQYRPSFFPNIAESNATLKKPFTLTFTSPNNFLHLNFTDNEKKKDVNEPESSRLRCGN